MTNARRIQITQSNMTPDDPGRCWADRGLWPARWLAWPNASANGCAYRLQWVEKEHKKIIMHISGDRKYRLFYDGELLGIGPELGDLNHYYFETYELDIAPGTHILSALVFDFKSAAGLCEMGLRPGFLVAAPALAASEFNTGFAAWEALAVEAWSYRSFHAVNPCIDFDGGKYQTGLMSGGGKGWQLAGVAEIAGDGGVRNEFPPERLLRPAVLPPRIYQKEPLLKAVWVTDRPGTKVSAAALPEPEAAAWMTALSGRDKLTVLPHSRRRLVGTLAGYHCFYPQLSVKGGKGAVIKLSWAEGLYLDPEYCYHEPFKGRRDEIKDKYFVGANFDTFYPGGGEMIFFTPWWRCGRYVELTVETAAEAIEIGELEFFETRYPFESEIKLSTSDGRLDRILPLCLRTVQMCMHDTFMDCPYYEQLMYIGDARLESLVVLASSHDRKMCEKMLRMFAASARPDGWLYSRYPSRVCQIIPTFSPMWIASLHDYMLYQGDRRLLRELIGTARKIIDAMESRSNNDGLLAFEQGWNFVDWTSDWCQNHGWGVPPGGEYGVSGVVNWLFVYALVHIGDLCEFAGEPLAAAHYRTRAREQTARLTAAFWVSERGLFADDLDHKRFSEHSQCLAILSGTLPDGVAAICGRQLFAAGDLAQTSIYFSHYYFECCRVLRRMDCLFARLQLWFDCDNLGLATLLERPEPSRSDCHGWSGHPYYHVAATLAGIRPAAFGFGKVRITPQPGPLISLAAEMVHPAGKITADYRLSDGCWHGTILLPEEITGEAVLPDGRTAKLTGGVNCLTWAADPETVVAAT